MTVDPDKVKRTEHNLSYERASMVDRMESAKKALRWSLGLLILSAALALIAMLMTPGMRDSYQPGRLGLASILVLISSVSSIASVILLYRSLFKHLENTTEVIFKITR